MIKFMFDLKSKSFTSLVFVGLSAEFTSFKLTIQKAVIKKSSNYIINFYWNTEIINGHWF